MGIFDNAKEVRINNKVVKSIIGENNMTLYINGEISQPKSITLTNLGNSSVVYGTTVQLKATYSELGATLTGKTVTLYDGDTVKTTGTTDSNGEVTFSLPTLGVGSHQFKVTCNNTESDVITVVVNKITPTLSLSGSNISYGGTLSLSGVLSAGSGKSVKIYNGNTLVDTVTTTTDGAFSKSVTGLNAGSYTFKAVFDGDGVYNSVNSADLAITVFKASTSLTINVPLSLIYSDAFNITGVLTDANSNNLSGASVKLKVGDTVVDTQTTNSNGQVTFSQTPVSMGTHTFQLVYDGDANYNGCTSSSVTRQINAETTILNLTSPVNNATYMGGATIPISGTITTNDGETLTTDTPIAVKVYDENNNQLRQFAVTNGAFSGNITAPSSAGNHSITVKFEGASTVPSVPDEEPQLMYAQSEATRSYTVTSDSLTVTSNKNILSQADNDVATITATYNANDNSGKVVTFSGAEMTTTVSSEGWLTFGNEATVSNIQMGELKLISLGRRNNCLYISRTSSTQYRINVLREGDTYVVNDGKIDISQGFSYSGDTFTYTNNAGTVCTFDISGLDKQLAGDSNVSFTVTSSTVSAVTDSNGVASVSYNSQGAGDVTITAECMSVTETFVIYDYWKYDSSVHSTSAEVVNWDLPTGDFEITAYIERGTGGAFIQIGDGTNSNRVLFGHGSSNSDFQLYCGSNSWNNGSGNNTDHTLKIINGVAYYTVNGNTISQNAPTGLTHKLYQFAPWGNSKISNIRIKPL